MVGRSIMPNLHGAMWEAGGGGADRGGIITSPSVVCDRFFSVVWHRWLLADTLVAPPMWESDKPDVPASGSQRDLREGEVTRDRLSHL